jgi:hypothetical protein
MKQEQYQQKELIRQKRMAQFTAKTNVQIVYMNSEAQEQVSSLEKDQFYLKIFADTQPRMT